jgi:hypothetical protein
MNINTSGKASASSNIEQTSAAAAAAHKQRTLKAYVLNKYEQYKVSVDSFWLNYLLYSYNLVD